MVHKETKDKIRKTLSDKFGLDVDYEKIEKIAIMSMRMEGLLYYAFKNEMDNLQDLNDIEINKQIN